MLFFETARAPRPTQSVDVWQAAPRFAAGVGSGGVKYDLRLRGPDLRQLMRSDGVGRDWVEVPAEGGQAVLAGRRQMRFGHEMRSWWRRFGSRVVTNCPFTDDLLVSPVRLGLLFRYPGGERGVYLLVAGEGPARENVVADDQGLAFVAARALGPVGGERIGIEVVVACEPERLRMEGCRLARSRVMTHDRFGAVVDGRYRDPVEVRECPPMAVEERLRVQAGGEAAERIV